MLVRMRQESLRLFAGGSHEGVGTCSIVLTQRFDLRSTAAQDPVPVCSRFSETPAGRLSWRSSGRGGQLQGTRVCLLAWWHYGARLRRGRRATSGIRCRRQLHSRDRPPFVRLVVCTLSEDRQG